jgi:histidyl-tRNA synthetase
LSTNRKIEARRLKGFQDYLPQTMAVKYAITDIARHVARISGFQPVGTPALEYAEVLLGEGGETDKQVYKFRDNGDRDVAMRFDLTMSFARFVAENLGTLNIPFKRIQIGDVWRAEKPQKGRYREFCQCDLDVIGVDGIAADVEILVCLNNILNKLNFGPFTQAIGNRVVLGHLVRSFFPELTDGMEQQIFIVLDKLDKIGPIKVAGLLNELLGSQGRAAEDLLAALLCKNGDDTDLLRIAYLLANNAAGLLEVKRLQDTLDLARKLTQGSAGKIILDLSIARGLGYYTGIVFETTVDSQKAMGSISSGGRYNRLLERFSDRDLPGVGGSIGVDRLVAVLEELGDSRGVQGCGIFVAVANDSALEYAFSVADRLRRAGLATDISLKSGKLGNQFKYAERGQYGIVITVGEKERDQSIYSVKVLATGQEIRDLPLSGIESQVLAMIEKG